MKFKTLFLSFFLFANWLDAQIISREALLKDPNIWWVGEFYSSMVLDQPDIQKLENSAYLKSMGILNNHRISLNIIKQVAARKGKTEYALTPESYELVEQLLDTENLKTITCYASADCKQKLSAAEIYSRTIDSVEITVFDTETFEAIHQKVAVRVKTTDIRHYQARHLVYYNYKKNIWNSYVEAIAPIVERYDIETDSFLGRRPLFWLKVENQVVTQDLNNPNITWARRTVRGFDWTDANVLMARKSINVCLDTMLEQTRQRHQTEGLHDSGDFRKLTPAELKIIGIQIDTLIAVNSDDFYENDESFIAKRYAHMEDISQFRLYQEWYWDDKQQKMMLTTCFFAPVIKRFDDNGVFLHLMPMFWKPTK